jgi:pimeloyl-ACP methyl ester carboxylesterase
MTFVLVHGAWHGGWCWARVVPLLRQAGHEVFTPTLTGLGERAHLLNPGIDLDTHVRDVVALLEMEDLHDVVLVGHSYGGMVITGAADRAPSRLRRLVYLDAFVPENGKALVDYIPPERAAHQQEIARESGTLDPMPLAALGLSRADDIAWVAPRLVKQPYKTMTQPLGLRDAGRSAISRTFVDCHSATGTFNQFIAKLRDDPGWRYQELHSGHDAMVSDPEGVARILLES